MSLHPEFTFDRYVPSAPRAVAPAVCRRHARGGRDRDRCLILHGPPGVGKTHLLHAIGHAARAQNATARVVLMTGADLAADLVEALRRDSVPSLRRKYTQADVLLVDDLHVLAERPATQTLVAEVLASCLADGVVVACAATCGARDLWELSSSFPAACRPRRLVLKRLSRAHLRRILRQDARSGGAVPRARVVDGIARQSGGDVRKALGRLARWHLEQKLSAGTAARAAAPDSICML